jgi:hypothetical protein
MLRLLDKAAIYKQTVNVEAWTSDGNINKYEGWLVYGRYWQGCTHKLVNPVNGQIRAVCDIFIFKINNLQVYL